MVLSPKLIVEMSPDGLRNFQASRLLTEDEHDVRDERPKSARTSTSQHL